MELSVGQWICALLGAVAIGLGKGGLPGVGNLAIPLYAMAFGAKASVGLLLPVLVGADIVAVGVYRRHAQWAHIRRLLPLTCAGVLLGYWLFERIPAESFSRWMGGILLVMTALHFLRKYAMRQAEAGHDPVPHSWWFISATGLSGGLATMIANAAGPIAAFYLMAVRLPKFAFVGTAAWFFFIINLFKMPLQLHLGNVTFDSLSLSLPLALCAALTASQAPRLIKIIPQQRFSQLVWAAVILAALKLLWG